jgi:hypothetical protein
MWGNGGVIHRPTLHNIYYTKWRTAVPCTPFGLPPRLHSGTTLPVTNAPE